MTVTADGDAIVLEADGRRRELTRDEAVSLREAIDDALTRERAFLRTVGCHREDGRYEVARRAADSAGNSKVFDSFAALERLFGRLPETFTAEAVGRSGITGSRRHMIVRHLCEHPAFDCEIERRNPLTARKVDAGERADDAAAGDADDDGPANGEDDADAGPRAAGDVEARAADDADDAVAD